MFNGQFENEFNVNACAAHSRNREWFERSASDFRDDEEYEMYVMTAAEIIKFNEDNPGKSVVWMVPND